MLLVGLLDRQRLVAAHGHQRGHHGLPDTASRANARSGIELLHQRRLAQHLARRQRPKHRCRPNQQMLAKTYCVGLSFLEQTVCRQFTTLAVGMNNTSAQSDNERETHT
jgi:triphosphoribosyl-dephospho-CoA synthetase